MAADYVDQARALRADVAVAMPATGNRATALASLDSLITALQACRGDERAEVEALAGVPWASIPRGEREVWIDLVRARRG